MPNKKLVLLVLLGLLLTPSALAEEEDLASDEEAFLSNTRQVTFEGRRAGEGYFGPNGEMLVFQSERDPKNPFFQIYLLDLEMGDTRKISPGEGKTTCSWIHPDADRVLFASTHDDPEAVSKQKEELELRATGQQRRYSWDYDEHFELYERDLRSNDLRQLTDARGYDAEASWSPDGKYIAFSSNRHAYATPLSEEEKKIFETDKSYFLDLYIMEADGSNLRRLTDVPGYDGGPFFSADGKKICWRRFSEDGATAEIYTMNIDGSDQKQITHLGAMSWAPFFHPSGDYLLFASNLEGFANFELYLVDAQGQHNPVRVTYTDGFDGLPAFSPGGNRLSWTSNRTGSNQSQIFFADWNDEYARSALGLTGRPETQPAILSENLKDHVAVLASEEFAGRLTGTEGTRLASSYLASVFSDLGLEPAALNETYFHSFEFTSGVSLGSQNLFELVADSNTKPLRVDEEWRPVAFSQTGETEASPVVFAGYGIVAPEEGDSEEYDSYVHLDVEGKWVLVLRYLPENVSPERRQHLSPYSGIRYKAMAARERGAKGLILVSGPNSQVEDELIGLSFDASIGMTSITVVSAVDSVAERLLSRADKDLQTLQNTLDQGELVMGFELPDTHIRANIDIVHEKRIGRNVLARLGSSFPDEPAVLVGAHYDHLGTGAGMSTLAREDEKEEIHYGADDNASGVASVLEIAEYLVDLRERGRFEPKRDVIFALWAGEELGLLGSSAYTEDLGKGNDDSSNLSGQLSAYLNLDMVGRLRENLILQGIGSSSVWASEIEQRNAPIGLAITTQNDSYLPTDATSFYLKHVPVLSAFTGTHSEYHSPRDVPETLNYDGMEDISKLTALIARSLAMSDEEPDYQEMKRPTESAGRVRLRAYLGTIPDYAQEGAEGVKLSGVIGGGPAEEAGLKGGDVIVELAGRTIENIYDYTYAIEALKIGDPVKVVVSRNGEKLELEVTPGSRE